MVQAKVLVVDDERDTVEVLCELLETFLPVETVPAYSASEARQHLQDDGDTVLALVDHVMPGESGLHLIHELRARHPELAFILITALFCLEEESQVPVMYKPLDPDVLVAAVAGALRAAPPRGRFQGSPGTHGLQAWLHLRPRRQA